MSDTMTRPKTTEPSTGEPLVAHIIKKDDQMRGYVLGEAIETLCGKKIVPTRDPNRYPICEACKTEFHRVKSAGSN